MKVKVKLTVLPNEGGILKLDLRKVVTRKFAILKVTYNKGDKWYPVYMLTYVNYESFRGPDHFHRYQGH